MMFVLVLIGWVFFRAESFGVATEVLAAMFTLKAGPMPEGALAILPALLIAAYWSMVGRNTFEWNERVSWQPAYGLAMAAAFGAAIAVMSGGRDSPFLYFQF